MAPLTAMSKKWTKRLQWDISAGQAFEQLKKAFTITPILSHPDPTKPFVVEVDASETGVVAIISQWSGEKPKLHWWHSFPGSYPLPRGITTLATRSSLQ